jgi:hypothetical protein
VTEEVAAAERGADEHTSEMAQPTSPWRRPSASTRRPPSTFTWSRPSSRGGRCHATSVRREATSAR